MRWALAMVIFMAACSVDRPPSDATGAEIYTQLCANCHADDLSGRVGPALGPGSNSAEQPDQFLHLTISEGRGRMPSFSSKLDDGQIERLIGYLREVQRG